MRFQPKSKEELDAMNLVQPGQYNFEVIEAKETKSKSGNDMMALKLMIWDQEGRERIVFDYLLEAMAFKLRHFCEATGLLNKYESGTLVDQDCLGKSGVVELIIQKDKTGAYADKNAVKDYICKADANRAAIPPADDFQDSEIPF